MRMVLWAGSTRTKRWLGVCNSVLSVIRQARLEQQMKKTFGAKIGFVPYASVVIGTYDKSGNPDAMNVGWAM